MRPSPAATITAQTLLTLAIFAADFTLRSGRSIVALYVVVVILAFRQSGTRRTAVTAAICIVLTAAGYLLRHGIHWQTDYLARRAFCAIAIVIAAILTIRNQMLEQQRRERAARLDLTGDAIFVRATNGIVTSWSRGAERLYGWSTLEAVGRHYRALIVSGQVPDRIPAWEDFLRDGRWEGEMVHRLRDGRDITVMSRWALQTDRGGRPLAILEINSDISDSKRAEAEIRRSDERYRRIFDMTGAAIWEEDYSTVLPMIADLRRAGVTDFYAHFRANPDTALAALTKVRVVDVNQTAVIMFQAVGKADLMQSLDRVFLPETLDSFCKILAALAEGRPSCETETTVRTLRGERRSILISVTFPLEREPLTSVLVSIMDNTERTVVEESLRLMQEELAQATRVATLGELTSSIARDIDEPITAIIAHGRDSLRAIRSTVPDIPAASRSIGSIIEEGTRAADVVIRIRNFLRKATPQHAAFDLSATIEAAALLVRRELVSHHVVLELDLAEDLPEITGNRARIEHVIVHLMVDAIQSMSKPGSNAHGRRNHLRIGAVRQDREVIIDVQDNARGRGEAIRGSLFEPVFTTREDRSGEDIGLAVCRATIEAHGGRIASTGTIGLGTTVQIALPIYATVTP